MARRGGAGGSLERYALQLEDQSGNPVNFVSDTDKYALITGLVLHSAGKRQLADGDYRAALETLTSGDEAFNLCNSAHLKVRAVAPGLTRKQVELLVRKAAPGAPWGLAAWLGVWAHLQAVYPPGGS